ncbi:glycoside hydrolase domain-containing protein [Planctomycetota bacterium]
MPFFSYASAPLPLKPVRIVGTRNGTFSAQVVMGSDTDIVKPQVKMSDLKLTGGEGMIPADGIRIRYPLPTGGQGGIDFRGVYGAKRFDAMAETAPEKVAVAAKRTRKGHTGPVAVPGAVQPVWITVKVPTDAAPGAYAGKLTLSAEGVGPVEVPVKLSVADWVMTDVKKFASHVGIINSPESEAMYYKKEMWSEEHWKLVEHSMKIMGEAGTSCLFIPMVARHHFGKYSMVRWVKKDDGTFEYDFTLFDKYVDLAVEHLGTLQVVCLYVWEPTRAAGSRHNRKKENVEKQTAPVNTFDPKTGEVGEMPSPFYIAPEAADFWKPVLTACRERLLKKGIAEKALMVGMISDRHPIQGEVETFKKAAPWATWIKQAHGKLTSIHGVKVGHLAFVWGTKGLKDPSEARGKGWKKDFVYTVFPRAGSCRTMRAGNLMNDHWINQDYLVAAGYRGLGRIGADFWPVVPGQRNHYGGATLAGAYAGWGQTTISESVLDLLWPGPEGAIWTLRLETYRQGVQEAEARIFIEKALDNQAMKAKLGEELAKRAQDLLDERARRMLTYTPIAMWYPGSPWEDSSEKLYAVAAEVAAALK